MPHSVEPEKGVVETFLEYYAPNSDGSLPDANDLEVQYGRKNLDLKPVKVRDMRSREFKLEEDGFTLIKHESAMTDFTDREKVKKEYYPEVAEAIKKHTGASKVICFNHNVRSSALPGLDLQKQKVDHVGPMRRVHIDVAPGGVSEAVTKRAGEEFMSKIQGRWKIMNAWKPIKTVERDPLGVAVAASVPDEDLINLKRYRPDGSLSESRYAVKAGEGHKWYYVPQQRTDEMILFTQYSDSSDRGIADRVAHCAFVLPGTEDKPIRESVEVRALVVF